MITKWRSPDWQNPYGKPRMGKKASRWYELGADAMLQSLRKEGGIHVQMTDDKGITQWYQSVHIPDDPQPEPKEQLMICPKAGKCEWQSFGCEGTPHKAQEICEVSVGHCPECVPYEPEKEIKLSDLEWAWDNLDYNYTIPKLHPASKVIESGYFCNKNFHQVPNSPFFHICNRYFSDGNTGGIY